MIRHTDERDISHAIIGLGRIRPEIGWAVGITMPVVIGDHEERDDGYDMVAVAHFNEQGIGHWWLAPRATVTADVGRLPGTTEPAKAEPQAVTG